MIGLKNMKEEVHLNFLQIGGPNDLDDLKLKRKFTTKICSNKSLLLWFEAVSLIILERFRDINPIQVGL